jgi:hypothetical protein
VCAILVYVCLALLAPVLHHDFICHLKSPAHCPACAFDGVASRPVPALEPVALSPDPVALRERESTPSPDGLPLPLRPGRAPPSA